MEIFKGGNMKTILFFVICFCWAMTAGEMLSIHGWKNFNTILAIIGMVSWFAYTCPYIKY